jgi:hypothetical protein
MGFTAFAYAQKVQMKDGKVFLDDVAILSYEKEVMKDEYDFYSINGSDKVLHLSYIVTGPSRAGYTKFFFPKRYIKFESTSVWFGVDSKPVIKKLIKEGVIMKDGTIDADKAEEFEKKYERETQ